MRARDALILELKGDELAGDPVSLLLLEERLAREVLLRDELRDPAQACF